MSWNVKVTGERKALLSPGNGNYLRIADKAGVTPGHVSRVLRGSKGASLHVAARIARAAGVTLDELYAHILAQPTLRVQGRCTLADRRRRARRKK